MEHAEFLDLSGEPPMRVLTGQMIKALEDEGPVLMYTSYERQVIQGLAKMLPDLAGALQQLEKRLVDLHPITRANYYHPDMLGSWSLKAVLPTIAPDMDYAKLEGITEGTEASSAYLEAIHHETGEQRKELIRKNLLKYCNTIRRRWCAWFISLPDSIGQGGQALKLMPRPYLGLYCENREDCHGHRPHNNSYYFGFTGHACQYVCGSNRDLSLA